MRFIPNHILLVAAITLFISCENIEDRIDRNVISLPFFEITDSAGKVLSVDLISKGNHILCLPDSESDVINVNKAITLFEDVNSNLSLNKILITSERKIEHAEGWDKYHSSELVDYFNELIDNSKLLFVVDGVIVEQVDSSWQLPQAYCAKMHKAFVQESKNLLHHFYKSPPHIYINIENLISDYSESFTKVQVFFINDVSIECDDILVLELLQGMRLRSDVKQLLTFGPNIEEHVKESVVNNFPLPCHVLDDSKAISDSWKMLDYRNYLIPTNFVIEKDMEKGNLRSVYLDCKGLKEFVHEIF